MLTALRRISQAKLQNGAPSDSERPQVMSRNLQRKFSQGVQYNMKIVIKGDKGSGKTSLFRRLQGKPIGEYTVTDEIQVANVNWNYKNVDDIVKVEVWDVVDKGRKRSAPSGLKLDEAVTLSLDAEFIDVYKGTNGAIIVMDITKNWTFTYVQNELLKIPKDVPVLVLGNHCDMYHRRTVSNDTVRYYIDSVQRPKGQAQIKYAESSMVNGFGLRYVYKFLALPFLQLKRKTLERQIERNAEEIDIALQEIDLFASSPLSDFSSFLNELYQTRRKNAEHFVIGLKEGTVHEPSTPSVCFESGHPINRCQPSIKPMRAPLLDTQVPVQNRLTNQEAVLGQPSSWLKHMKSVEDFVPEGSSLDDQFFQETPSIFQKDLPSNHVAPSSDSESDETVNPLVANFQEDIDLEDRYVNCVTYQEPFAVRSKDSEEHSCAIPSSAGNNASFHELLTHSMDMPLRCTTEKFFNLPEEREIVGNGSEHSLNEASKGFATKQRLKILTGEREPEESNEVKVDQKKIKSRKESKLLQGTQEMLKSSRARRAVKLSDKERLKDSDDLVLTEYPKMENKHKKTKDGARSRSKKKMKSREEPLSDSLKDLEFFAL